MKKFFIVLMTTAILFPLSASSAIQGDINGDGRIDTLEAIYALQVAAGLYPEVSTSCLLSGKGDWTTSTLYAECDVVSYGGENYVCNELVSHTSSSGVFGDDAANWDLLSLKGDTGATGQTGPIGETGATGPVGQAKGLSIGKVETGSGGAVWLDRNLGASQIATVFNDEDAYGDLYQWGRGVDGHESRTSPTTTVLSSSDSPKHDNFILSTSGTYDWRDGQNTNLWQGVNGINNPCPAGFRLPTETEWITEYTAWDSQDYLGAFASPLKLVLAGFRSSQESGAVNYAGSNGYYWSSTVFGSDSHVLSFHSSGADVGPSYRANGFSVRCLKD